MKDCFGYPDWKNDITLETKCMECQDRTECLEKYYKRLKTYEI
jgi:hypothetical protein